MKENLVYIIIIIVIILVKCFVVTPVRVNGESMLPTLKENDIMILNKLAYKSKEIKRFDIVVIKAHGELIIKRVIGLPGDKITYKDNQLYVNGKKVKENFTKNEHEQLDDYIIQGEVVPEGKYFVVGDNRPKSLDSRSIGYIKKKNIKGKCNFTIFPFSRIGKKK